MAAPDYVPASYRDEPRLRVTLPPPDPWLAKRPADLPSGQPVGPGLGKPGPDQGYALALAERLHDRLRLFEREEVEDVMAAAVAVALRRASLFGRAPVIHDLELVFRLFGFLDEAPPPDLVEFRQRLFSGAADQYWDRRRIADLVPESTLRLTPGQLGARLGDWRQLLGVSA